MSSLSVNGLQRECVECGAEVEEAQSFCHNCGAELPLKEDDTNKISHKREIGPKIKLMDIYSPLISSKARPGQFVILHLHEKGKRFPLTIAGTSPEEGTIRLIFNEVGKATQQLGSLEEGDRILNMPGPLGNPTEIENFGKVICFGGGIMAGPLLWLASAFKEAGNYVITVVGARTRELLFFTDEFKSISDEFYAATDDGSYGYKDLAFIEEILAEENIDRVYGTSVTTDTLRELSNITKENGVKTVCALTPVMVDGSGMCGACRVLVGGEKKFACVDGPDFDAHEVDWDVLEKRKRMYSFEEKLLLLSQKNG